MNKYAVAYLCVFEKQLSLEIVEARDWMDALLKASVGIREEWLLSGSISRAKIEAFNHGCMFEITEIEN